MLTQTLGLRTQILEALDWDEDLLEKAVDFTYDVLQDLKDDGATPYEAKSRAMKVLMTRYNKNISRDLIEYILLDAVVTDNIAEA